MLSGVENFRSLAGMPTADGRGIKGHLILRSGQLHRMASEDWAQLHSLGLRTVCDLRSSKERERYPSQLVPDGLQMVSMEMLGDVRTDPLLAASLDAEPNAEGALQTMLAVYRRLPDVLAPHLPRLFRLFEAGEVPVLVHCAAGKDRTGFTVAVVLHALGVAPDDIMSDYLLSAPRDGADDGARREVVARFLFDHLGQPGTDAMVDTLLDARPEFLSAAFDAVNARFGSMDGYLKSCAGLDAHAFRRLRDRSLCASI